MTPMINITPRHLRCDIFGCPAVYRLPEDKIAVIGKKAPLALSTSLKGKVAEDELLIVIDRALLANVTPVAKKQRKAKVLKKDATGALPNGKKRATKTK